MEQKTVVVITPTTGNPDRILKAAESVHAQKTKHKIEHIIAFDGVKCNFDRRIKQFKKAHVIEMPFQTGKDGFYGHRIYSGFSKMVDGDYVCLLDDDNWFERDHIDNLVSVLEEHQELDFCFSKRKIFDKDGNFICVDNCESLGVRPIWCSVNRDEYHVDTSSYCFRNKMFREYGHHWDWGWGADRRFFKICKDAGLKYCLVHDETLCYRLDGNEGSVTKDFFLEGNAWYEKQNMVQEFEQIMEGK